jgi:hypothetical protein
MRRESSTVVVLVGDVDGTLLAGLDRSANISVVRPAAARSAEPPVPARPTDPGWEPGAAAMRAASRCRSTYVVVLADPLAAVAAGWHAMWDMSRESPGAAAFEEPAAAALAAWRDNRFELPDYYLVAAPPQGSTTGADLYLGPLRAARPRRVAVAAQAASPAQEGSLLDRLRALEHGPWWPPLDELLDAARGFYAGGLTPAQH